MRRSVANILAAVRKEGDSAVARFTTQFDGRELPESRVAPHRFEEAFDLVGTEGVADLRAAIEQTGTEAAAPATGPPAMMPKASATSASVASRPNSSCSCIAVRRILAIRSTRWTGTRIVRPWFAMPRLMDCLIHHAA
jgi:hypothetical protein